MAEHTSNINLAKPTYSEDADIAVINSNMDIIDGKMGAVGSTSVQAQLNTASTNITNLGKELCAVVAGKQSTTGAATGEYVIVRGSTISGISDGAYIAAKTIPANTNLDSSYFSSTGMTKGIANALNDKIANYQGAKEWVSNVDCNNYTSPGVYLLAQNLTNAPYTWFTLIVLSPRSDVIQQIALKGDGHITTRSKGSSSWSNWEGLALNSEIESFVKMGSTTGTTDANGNLQLTTASMSSVIFAWDGNHVCIPFFYNNKWYVRVQDVGSAGTAYTNHSVTVNYHYISRTIS